MDPWDAINQWLDGDSIVDQTIWGLSIIWIVRIGKILQFLAALAVILDLVGPEKLKAIGDAALDRLAQRRERWRSRRRFKLGEVFGVIFLAQFPLTLIIVLGGFIFSSGFLEWVRYWSERRGSLEYIVMDFKMTLIANIVLWPSIALLRLLVNYAIPAGFYVLVCVCIYPLQFCFRKENPGHPLRWIAFFLFLIGFAMDFMGS